MMEGVSFTSSTQRTQVVLLQEQHMLPYILTENPALLSYRIRSAKAEVIAHVHDFPAKRKLEIKLRDKLELCLEHVICLNV
jgi:hypothetical protein